MPAERAAPEDFLERPTASRRGKALPQGPAQAAWQGLQQLLLAGTLEARLVEGSVYWLSLRIPLDSLQVLTLLEVCCGCHE